MTTLTANGFCFARTALENERLAETARTTAAVASAIVSSAFVLTTLAMAYFGA